MGLRPGKTKGPYVGPNNAAAPGDHKVLADGTDTTAEYLGASLVAGTNITLTVVDKGGGNKAVEIDAATSPDIKAKVSAADTTSDYLNSKIVAGTNVTKTILNPGVNETLEISAATSPDIKAKVSAADTTSDYLNSKIVAGTNVTKTILNPGVNETLSLAAADPTTKASAGDTTASTLDNKIVAGTNVTITKLNPGGNESLSIAAATSPDIKAKVSAADTTADYLNSKIVAGTNITKTILNPGANETLQITSSFTDVNVKASAGDTTPSTLDNKMVAGANITITKLNPGANESLSIAAAASALDYKFKVSAADTTANYGENKILAGSGITVTKENPAGNEDLKIALAVNAIPSFRDDFYYYRPFWDGLMPITSGRWSIDLVNHWIICNSGTTEDEIRIQMEGDFDLQLKMVHPGTGATKAQVNSDGDVTIASIEFNGTNITAKCTGKSNTVVANANTTMWIRFLRTGGTRNIGLYYKINDADAWILIAAYTDVDLGPETELDLVGNANSKLINIILYDNTGSQAVGARQQKWPARLTDGANIATDCTRGDTFAVTLAGNRTMDNPTSVERWQKIIYKIKQDGTGGRTLAWGTDFRFPGGTAPVLTTAPNKTDYIGFIHNPDDSKFDMIADVYNL